MKNDKLSERAASYIKRNPVRFHVPSHKGRGESRYIDREYDITELDFSDNLSYPESVIREHEKRLSGLFGVRSTSVTLNGSSSALMAAVMSCARAGEKVLIPSDSHLSAYYGVMHAGAVLIRAECADPFSGCTFEELQRSIEAHPGIKAAVLTYPTYYGCCGSLEKMISYLRSKGIMSIADAAHGTHLRFGEGYPAAAEDCGCDLAVHSGYKTINGPTQSAMLHNVSGQIPAMDLRKWLRTINSTSPSYPLLLSFLEAAEGLNASKNELTELYLWYNELAEFLEKTPLTLLNYEKSRSSEDIKFDPLKLPVDFSYAEMDAGEAAGILRENFGIYAEMHDDNVLLLAAGLNSVKEDYDMLKKALGSLNLKGSRKQKTIKNLPPLPKQLLDMKSAMQMRYEWTDIDDAQDRISADFLSVYPPGAPLILPGSLISRETAEYYSSAAGERTAGFAGKKIKVLKI